MLKHLKIVAKGFETYDSLLGPYKFNNGVSAEPLPRAIRDKLSASMQMVEIEEDGSETPAGVAYRLVSEAKSRAPIAAPLTRQTEEEAAKERLLETARAEKPPVERYFTKSELEEHAGKVGIKGLRAVSDAWGVKHRSIPVLIEMILKAQADFLAARNLKMQLASQKQVDAVEEAKVAKALAEKAVAEKQAEFDKIAATLVGSSVLASAYRFGFTVVTLGKIVADAHVRSSMTVTGWNNLADEKREELLQREIGILEAHYGAKAVDAYQAAKEEALKAEAEAIAKAAEEAAAAEAAAKAEAEAAEAAAKAEAEAAEKDADDKSVDDEQPADDSE